MEREREKGVQRTVDNGGQRSCDERMILAKTFFSLSVSSLSSASFTAYTHIHTHTSSLSCSLSLFLCVSLWSLRSSSQFLCVLSSPLVPSSSPCPLFRSHTHGRELFQLICKRLRCPMVGEDPRVGRESEICSNGRTTGVLSLELHLFALSFGCAIVHSHGGHHCHFGRHTRGLWLREKWLTGLALPRSLIFWRARSIPSYLQPLSLYCARLCTVASKA